MELLYSAHPNIILDISGCNTQNILMLDKPTQNISSTFLSGYTLQNHCVTVEALLGKPPFIVAKTVSTKTSHKSS